MRTTSIRITYVRTAPKPVKAQQHATAQHYNRTETAPAEPCSFVRFSLVFLSSSSRTQIRRRKQQLRQEYIYFVSFVAFVAVCVCPRERKKKPTTRVHEHGEERPRRTNNENPSRHGIYQRTDGRITAVSVQYILTKRQQRKRKPPAYTYLGLESSHRGSKRGNRHVDDDGGW